MKKILTYIVAAIFATGTAAATDNYTSKAYKSSMDFHKIEACNMVHVIVEKRTEGNIVAKIHNDFLPYFKIEVSDGTLTAKIDRGDHRSKRGESTLTYATVYVPNNYKIDNIDASTLSRVTVQCDIKAKEVEIEASGVSHIALQSVTAESFDIDISGASHFSTKHALCKELECDASGASNLTICGIFEQTDIDCAGASNIKLNNSVVKRAEVEIAGASNLDCDNSAFEDIAIEISGASNADVAAKRCRAIVAGASKADIECDEHLTLDVSGVSHVKYSGDCKLEILSNSGMSTIKKR